MKHIRKFNENQINESEGKTPKEVWGDKLPPCPTPEAWHKILTSLAWQYDKDWAESNDIILQVGRIASGVSSGYGGGK